MSDKDNLQVRCPRCRTPVVWQDNSHRPFCSEKCRLIDLGRWADEEYRIPVPPAEADDFSTPDRADEED